MKAQVDPVKSVAEPVAATVQSPVAVVAEAGKAATQPMVAEGTQAATLPVAPDARQATPLAAEEPQGTGFWLAAGRYGDVMLADLGSEFVVASAGVMAHLGADAALELMPDMQRGLIEPSNMEGLAMLTLAGRLPGTLWMSAATRGERTSSNPFMYYRKDERWQRKATKVGLLDWYYGALAPYADGQLLGLRLLATGSNFLDKYDGDLPASMQKKVDATMRANPPRLDVLAGGVMTPSPMKLAAGGTPIHFTALPTGEVFVLLSFSGEGESATRFAVQRFTPGVDAGVVDSLTKLWDKPLDLYNSRLVARAADDVYLAGGSASSAGEPPKTGLIARFDGKLWATIAAPPELEVIWLALGANNEMWAIAGRAQSEGQDTTALWKRVGEGPWTEVVLPKVRTPAIAEPRWGFHVSVDDWHELPGDPVEAAKPMQIEPSQVYVHDDEVWVLAGVLDVHVNDHIRQVVLRSKPVTRVLELPDAAYIAALPRTATARPYDPKKGCDTGPAWVPVATLAAGAAVDAAAPIAAAFLTSLSPELQDTFTTLREVEARGRRMIALTFHADETFHPDGKYRPDELIAAVQRFRPDEPHTIECWNPRPIRSFYEKEG